MSAQGQETKNYESSEQWKGVILLLPVVFNVIMQSLGKLP